MRLPALCLLGILLAPLTPRAAMAAPPALTISGKVGHVLKLDTIAVRGYPADQVVALMLPGAKPVLVRGVRLKAFLANARLVGAASTTIVVATGRDGSAAVFSWNELFNSPAGDSVLVVFERNDKVLPETEGPLGLVAGGDTGPAARNLKRLVRIEVRQVALQR